MGRTGGTTHLQPLIPALGLITILAGAPHAQNAQQDVEIVSSSDAGRIVFVVARRPAAATTQSRAFDEAGFAPVLIPEGYHHRQWSGIDCYGGAIWNDGGLRIDYVMDRYGPNQAKGYPQTARTIWRTAKRTPNGSYDLAADHEAATIVVTFDGFANFMATRLKSRHDLADALNIITTYELGAFRRPLKAMWDLIALGFPQS